MDVVRGPAVQGADLVGVGLVARRNDIEPAGQPALGAPPAGQLEARVKPCRGGGAGRVVERAALGERDAVARVEQHEAAVETARELGQAAATAEGGDVRDALVRHDAPQRLQRALEERPVRQAQVVVLVEPQVAAPAPLRRLGAGQHVDAAAGVGEVDRVGPRGVGVQPDRREVAFARRLAQQVRDAQVVARVQRGDRPTGQEQRLHVGLHRVGAPAASGLQRQIGTRSASANST